jgi:hypothetical protein
MRLNIFALSTVLAVLGACSRETKPLLNGSRSPMTPVISEGPGFPTPRTLPQNVTAAEVRVSGDIVMAREDFDGLMGQEFLFGSDIQMSDEAGAILSGGAHVISKFERHGDRLVLVGDESILKESDFPAKRTLVEFEITENDDSVGLKLVNPGSASALQWGVATSSTQWIRSAEFDTKDKLFLLEVSLVSGNKSHHFMESIFPRGRFGDSTKALIQDGPTLKNDDDTQNYLGALSRMGYFSANSWLLPPAQNHWSATVAKKEQIAALRFDISENRTIDWYVTGNLPDTLLADIGAGIEGWNRYFNEFRPESPVMRFRGKLPATIKLGDPRYNVILFDAVADAPAAYESQAFDPATGIQTHSMIYMPWAWYNIGKGDYVEGTRDYMPNAKLKLKTRCQRELHAHDTVETMVLERGLTPEAAGRALMRSTLLHEVGHALGMQHNFAASLRGKLSNRANADWLYSDSVMDYNTPTLEDAMLFKALDENGAATDPTVGAKLGYDRQFIDITYNSAKQVLATPAAFPVLPNCNDDVADDKVGGINPLCIRYDFFGEPRERLALMRDRLTSQETYLGNEKGRFITLAGLLNRNVTDSKTKITNAGQDEVAQVFVGELLNLAKVARAFSAAGYVSARSAINSTANLLGEWKAFSPEMISNDDTALFTGLASLPIFDETGTVSADLFASYQKNVRTSVLAFLGDAMNAYTGKNSQFEPAFQQVARSADELIAAAKAQNVPEEVVAVGVNKLSAQVAAIRKRLGDTALKAVEGLNYEGVFVTAEGKAAGRADLNSEIANQIYLMLREFVASENADSAMRLRAVAVLAKFPKRTAMFDTTALKASWKLGLKETSLGLRREFSALETKRQSTGYLSDEERATHENLAQMITLLRG